MYTSDWDRARWEEYRKECEDEERCTEEIERRIERRSPEECRVRFQDMLKRIQVLSSN